MPELPEVETIVNQLDKALKGKVIEGVEVLREKSFIGESRELVDQKIGKVGRKSKMIVVEFENFRKVLVVHLKMTGQLVLLEGKKRTVGGHPTADWVSKLPSKHTRIVIKFSDGSKLFFNDMRVFGWMKLLESKLWKKELERLPLDVTDKGFTLSIFKEVISGSSRAIKLVLLDQKKMGGVGNIYANDGLFLAGIDPKREARSLNMREVEKLWKAIVKVMNKGILLGGASYSDYKDTKGLGGSYQNHFLVYGKDGKMCDECGGKIEKFKIGGRGSYWCKHCQK